MDKKRIISGGSAVEMHGRASLSAMVRKTHGRASLLAGLLFLFASCEKDIAEGYGEGKKVEIFFSVNTTNYQAGGNVVRNAGARDSESTTMYINDSLYLQTTLVPDSEEELRGPVTFKEGQKLCFAAFLTSGVQVGTTAVYTYSGGKWTPVGDPLGVTPDNSTEYRFVAYSYFDETGTPPTDNSTIDPVHDLVWGMSANTKIEDETEAARTVSIGMTHKFARVKVVVKSGITGANITDLSGVEIVGGQLATLTPFDGDISWSGTATQGIADPFTVISDTERESGYRTVMPVGAGSLKVKVGSIQVSSTATVFANQTVSFTPALSAATSYTLVVNLKRCVWARSNIYWNGSTMTFVPAGNDLSKQGYQGVLFKFGSMVGVSPVGDFVADSTPVYKAGSSTSSTYSDWIDIPYWDSGDVGDPIIGDLKGDICKYLSTETGVVSGDYRLPRNGEFGTTNGWNQDGWVMVNSWSNVTTGDIDGTYDFIANGKGYAKNTTMGDVCFPTSGRRYGYFDQYGQFVPTGLLLATGLIAAYWSGSIYYVGYPYALYATTTSVYPNDNNSQIQSAYPIRCVLDLN
jgi:hypothetical protein